MSQVIQPSLPEILNALRAIAKKSAVERNTTGTGLVVTDEYSDLVDAAPNSDSVIDGVLAKDNQIVGDDKMVLLFNGLFDRIISNANDFTDGKSGGRQTVADTILIEVHAGAKLAQLRVRNTTVICRVTDRLLMRIAGFAGAFKPCDRDGNPLLSRVPNWHGVEPRVRQVKLYV